MVSAVRHVLVGASNLDRALKLFRDTMGLRVEWSGAADPSLLAAWRLPTGTTAQLTELSCKGHPYGRLLLAQFDPVSDERVRVDFGDHAHDGPLDVGPKAIDFYVADPISHAVKLVTDAGYPTRGEPRKHIMGSSFSEEVVITGPDDLPMLIMVGHRHLPQSLRPGSPDGDFSEIATVSVIAGDLDATRAFYGEVMGLVAVNDAETAAEYRDQICELVDAPPGTRVHAISYAQPGQASGKILTIRFVNVDAPRLAGRMRPGVLGFSLLSHTTDDLDALERRISAYGAEIITPPTDAIIAGTSRRMMLVRGPNEEMFEFVET